MNPKLISAAAAALLAMSGSAFAAMATAATDLNIRSGPGPQFDVIGVIGAGKGVNIRAASKAANGSPLPPRPAKAGSIPTISPPISAASRCWTDRPGNSEIAVVTAPQGAAIDGTVTGALVTARWRGRGCGRTSHHGAHLCHCAQPRPIYLDGETVVGAALPDGVDIREIPDYPVPLRLPERPAGASRTRQPQDRLRASLRLGLVAADRSAEPPPALRLP